MVSLRRTALAQHNSTVQRSGRSRKLISYAEPDTDDDGSFSDSSHEGDAASPPPIRPRASTSARARPQRNSTTQSRISPRNNTRKRSQSVDTANFDHAPQKRRRYFKPISKPASNSVDDTPAPTGIIPPWQNLPYQILVDIFRYASCPLYDDTFQSLPSGKWLLAVACLCRAFAEPAFTVLYTSPPLAPKDKAHLLVDLLKTETAALAFGYRQKVKSLRIDVKQVAYSMPGRGTLDIFGLIKDLPRLLDLEFYHEKDRAPYRELDASIKWNYSAEIFDALEYIDPNADPSRGDKTSVCKLRSWRWSSRLAEKTYPIDSLRDVHLRPSFQGLRKIAFINYQVPPVRKGATEPPKQEEILADSLSVLPDLEHLIFESSTLVNGTLLPLLPKNLRTLELINCWEVTAEELGASLLTHGSQLRCLTLNHNISLSLSFLPLLAEACPRLEVLRVNLTYYNVHSFYNDSKPEYDKLISPGEVPTWPSSLQTIELLNLRQWETDAAEMFFQSLLDSAGTLSDLRALTINAILNIGWRDRASFRDKWIGSLDRVFKRVSSPPEANKALQKPQDVAAAADVALSPSSLKRKREDGDGEKVGDARGSKQLSLDSDSGSHVTQNSRRSTRAKARKVGQYAESPDVSEDENDAGVQTEVSRPSSRGKLSRELATLQQTAGRDGVVTPPDTDSAEDSDGVLLLRISKGKGKGKEVIQGMCEILKVRIDNLRPAENPVTEADFLDEEAPGDDDWNGDDQALEGYAW